MVVAPDGRGFALDILIGGAAQQAAVIAALEALRHRKIKSNIEFFRSLLV